LMMLAISREDFRSRFPAAALGCSVERWLSLAEAFLPGRVNGLSPWVEHSTLVVKEAWSQLIFKVFQSKLQLREGGRSEFLAVFRFPHFEFITVVFCARDHKTHSEYGFAAVLRAMH